MITINVFFKKLADRLEQPDASVKHCAILMQNYSVMSGIEFNKLMRMWNRYSVATGRKYF